MRHFPLLLFLLSGCVLGRSDAPTVPSPVVRAELIAAREAVWRAYFAGDSVALVRLLPPVMSGMGEDRGTIISNAQGFVRGGGRLIAITFTDDEFYVRGEMAVIWSRYRVDLSGPDGPQVMEGRAIELFAHEGGRWINPSWHLHEVE